MAKELLILGAGIGGLSVLGTLAESAVCLDDVNVTVVDEDFSHFLGFTLPWVMRGWRDQDSVPVRPCASALDGVRRITGTVRAIDPGARTVSVSTGADLAFDALIIATGARNAVDNIHGLRAAVDRGTAVHYYSAADAAQAHEALRVFRGGRLVFLVTSQPYRCPVAPYEGTLLAADLLRDNGSRGITEISVYSPEKHPMPSAGPHAGPELVGMLHDNGIEFIGEHSVARVDADRKEIHFDNGATATFDLLVFVPPHEPCVTLDGPGWINVDATTMQTRHPGIFAIGDATVVTSPSGRPLPKAAVFARNGAHAAALNVLRYFGKTETNVALSGEGYCYVDTGSGKSAVGRGNFFTMPHPDIHLSRPSHELHHDKRREEHDWRMRWEVGGSSAR